MLPFVLFAEGRGSLGSSEGKQLEPVSFSCVAVSQAKCAIHLFCRNTFYIFLTAEKNEINGLLFQDCLCKIYVSIDLEQPRAEQGIGSSETPLDFGGPCVYDTSNWRECKCIWQ